MKIYLLPFVIFAVLGSCSKSEKTQKTTMMKISWDTLASIPAAQGEEIQYGLAGAVAGTCNHKIIIAGGSNFKNQLPWQGGKKQYYDDIFILTQNTGDETNWEVPALKLPKKMAYSACLSANDAVYSFGGEDTDQVLNMAFKICFDKNRIKTEPLPEMPFAVSNAGAAIIGSTIYLAGGNDAAGATSHFQSLDLANPEKGWTLLLDLPEAESHAVVVSQWDGFENCIFVVGGRNKTGIKSTFLSSIQKYSPSQKRWSNAGKLQLEGQAEFGISAGTGIALGKYIFLFGGDKGEIFNRTETFNHAIEMETDSLKKQKIIAGKIESLTNHPGFNKEVLCFNPATGILKITGEIPGLSQVTTNAFLWNNKVVIPGGEIRPGIRTPLIRTALISLE